MSYRATFDWYYFLQTYHEVLLMSSRACRIAFIIYILIVFVVINNKKRAGLSF